MDSIRGQKISFFAKPKNGYGEVAAFLKAVNPHSYAGVAEREIRKIFLAAHARIFAYQGEELVGCGCITQPKGWENKHCPTGALMVRAFAAVKGLGKPLWRQLISCLPQPTHRWQAHRSVVLYTGLRPDFWASVGFQKYGHFGKYYWMLLRLCILPEQPDPEPP